MQKRYIFRTPFWVKWQPHNKLSSSSLLLLPLLLLFFGIIAESMQLEVLLVPTEFSHTLLCSIRVNIATTGLWSNLVSYHLFIIFCLLNELTSLNIFHVILRGVKLGHRHTTLANVSQLTRFKDVNWLLRINEGLVRVTIGTSWR